MNQLADYLTQSKIPFSYDGANTIKINSAGLSSSVIAEVLGRMAGYGLQAVSISEINVTPL